MGKAKRKMRPQPPDWWKWESDNCWFCKNRNNCDNCWRLRQFKKLNCKREHETE